MAVARTATITGNRATSAGSTTLGVTATCNTATTGGDHVAVVLLNISVSTDAQTTTCAVTYGGVAMTQHNLTAQGSTTNRVSIGLYTLVNPPTGAQNVVATCGGTATKTAIAVGGAVYSGVAALTYYDRGTGTGRTFSSVTSGMVICATTNGVALTSPNQTSLYLAGSSVAGVGDYISVQDAAGAATVAFTNSGTSTTSYTLGISLRPTTAAANTLVDAYATQDATLHVYGAASSVSGGQLVEVCNNSFTGSTYSNITYDLTNSEVVIQLVTRANVGNNGTETRLEISDAPVAAPANRLGFNVDGPDIRLRYTAALTNNDTTVTYNSTNHAWLRIKHSGGNILWDGSPDGTTWTNLRTVATPIPDLTKLFINTVVGYTGTEPTPGSGVWDNLNLPPAAASEGSASGTYTWAATSTGKRTPKGSGPGAYTWSSTATGKHVPKATAAEVYTWSSSAAGAKTSRGTTSGTYTWAATAAGTHASRGTGSGAYTWAATAAGKRTPKATGSGNYTWSSTAAGARASRGTSSGIYGWAGSAVGSAPAVGVKQGSSSGTYTWASTTTGDTPPNRGTTSGNYTWASTTAGKRTPKATGSGNYTWAGTTSGARASRGTGSGAYTWSSTATGIAPIVGAKQGTAAGTYVWASTTSGARVSRGTAPGTYTWSAAGTGARISRGSASGAYTWASTTTGKRTPKATSVGIYTWASTTAGRRTSRATGAGNYTWSSTATGVRPVVGAKLGNAVGTYTWAGAAVGRSAYRGSAVRTYGWDGAAIGWRVSRGTGGTRTYTFTGIAIGVRPAEAFRSGAVSSVYGWTSNAVGLVDPFGTTSGTYSWASFAAFIHTAPLHPDRVLNFTYETREMTMPAENRSITLTGENRTITVAGENRIITVAGENRTIIMPGENRTAYASN